MLGEKTGVWCGSGWCVFVLEWDWGWRGGGGTGSGGALVLAITSLSITKSMSVSCWITALAEAVQRRCVV